MATAREEQKRVQDEFLRLRNELPLHQAQAMDRLYLAAMKQGAALAIGEACRVHRGVVDPVKLAQRVEPLLLRSVPDRAGPERQAEGAAEKLFRQAVGLPPSRRG